MQVTRPPDRSSISMGAIRQFIPWMYCDDLGRQFRIHVGP